MIYCFYLLFGAALWIFMEVAVGYGMQHFYRRWHWKASNLNSSSLLVRLKERFLRDLKQHIRYEAEQHFLFNKHRDMVQPDGSHHRAVVFAPFNGWRWSTSTRVFLDPHQRSRPQPSPDRGLFTDKNGLLPNRSGEPLNLEEKDTGDYRIFLLGGSPVAGNNSRHNDTDFCIDNDGTIAAVCETKLNSSGDDVRYEVINAAVQAYSSVNEFLYYKLELCYYPHDLVLVIHGYNDANMALYHLKPEKAETVELEANRLNLSNWAVTMTERLRRQEQTSPIKWQLAQLLQVMRGLTSAILWRFLKLEAQRLLWKIGLKKAAESSDADSQEKTPVNQQMLQRMEAYAERMVKNDLHLAAVAAAEGKSTVVVLQPLLVTKQKAVGREQRFVPTKNIADLYRHFFAAARAQYQRYQDSFNTLNCRVVDLSDMFDASEEPIYSDLIHYSDLGISILTDRITDVVKAARDCV